MTGDTLNQLSRRTATFLLLYLDIIFFERQIHRHTWRDLLSVDSLPNRHNSQQPGLGQAQVRSLKCHMDALHGSPGTLAGMRTGVVETPVGAHIGC